ncbi:MAG: PilZ domain-containing protein [Erythrobacter sp.]
MTRMETRSLARDSLFLLANLQIENKSERHRVRVRNLSDGGMMAEATNIFVQRGNRVTVELRNIGEVAGSVAWVQDNRFGIAFDVDVDSQRARRPAPGQTPTSFATAERSWAHRAPLPPNPEVLRKL